jgi:demethoxyubiquinone hydroxylase (CLK1/Coq7/Cat5 family)
MLRRVALVRTDVSEELSASIIRVTQIGELGTTLVVTSNQRTVLKKYDEKFLAEFIGVNRITGADLSRTF